MAYGAPADLILRFDANDIASMISDTGVPVDLGDLDTNGVLLALLADSSGRIDAAAMVGGLYTTSDLAGMTGNSAALLTALCCDLTMVRLIRRRPGKVSVDDTAKMVEEVENYLDRLKKGERVFGNVAAAITAGQADSELPTAGELYLENRIDSRVQNFYPTIGQRRPVGLGGGSGGW